MVGAGFLSDQTLNNPNAPGTIIGEFQPEFMGTTINDLHEVAQIAQPGNVINLGGEINFAAEDNGTFLENPHILDFKVATWYSIVVPE
jgi:hypothetical protein